MQNYRIIFGGVFLLLCCAAVKAQGSFNRISSTTVNGMSPNGAYVVGNTFGYENAEHFKSFIYNVSTGEIEWKTTFSESNYDLSGQFNAITNTGIIAGAMKNKDMVIAVESGDFYAKGKAKSIAKADATTMPVVSGAVWKDGKTYCLGMGSHTVDELGDETDGSYATGITENGTMVVGYIQSWWIKTIPCLWTYDADTDSYTYQDLPLPTGCKRGSVKAISSDGSIMIGEATKNGNTYPVIWTSATTSKLISMADTPYSDSEADAVSPNGRYVLMHGNGYQMVSTLQVYDTTTGETTPVVLPNTENIYQCKGLAISDNGDIFCTISDTQEYTDHLYFYSLSSSTLADIDYFVNTPAPDIANMPSLANSKVVSVSANGKVIAGNSGQSGGWVLTSPEEDAVIINAPKVTDFFFSGADSVTLKWNACENVPSGVQITYYVVYIDGEQVDSILVDETKNDYSFKCPVSVGEHTAYVEALADYEGKEVKSAPSETFSTYLSAKNNLPFIDNFDDAVLDGNNNPVAGNDYWTVKRLQGDDACLIKWSLDANNYENNTPYMCTTSINTSPWSSAMYSPFITTENADGLYLSFYTAYLLVNNAVQDLSSDYLDVEYTTDGENWTCLKTICAADIAPYAWRFVDVCLDSDLSGKPFQIRFNAHGEGRAMLRWNIDGVSMNTEYTGKAPAAVRAIEGDDGKVELMWQNSIDSYEVSYLNNSSVLTDYCTGSEGNPLITAIDLTPEKMANYVGEYITSVSSFIFDNPYLFTELPTKAEAIIYVDGTEVTREKFDKTFDDPFSSTVTLSNPVKIESGKTYRVGIRIYDYDSNQTPLYYPSSVEFIPGASDLYSEDEGVTWQRLSDVYTTEDVKTLGQCIWPIRANITDSNWSMTGSQLDSELLGYNVYRDGLKINDAVVYASHPTYVDLSPQTGAQYTIRAFYKDGRVSDFSVPVTATKSAIERVNATDTGDYKLNMENGTMTIRGNYDYAELYDINGTLLSRTSAQIDCTGLTSGVYILRIYKEDSIFVRKCIIK